MEKKLQKEHNLTIKENYTGMEFKRDVLKHMNTFEGYVN